MVWWLAATAVASPSAAQLESAWVAQGAALAAHGPIPMHLSPEDFATLAGGEPVAHRVDTEAGAFATGAVWVDAPIAHAWIAVQDARDRPLGRDMHNEILVDEPGHRIVYMRMALPWPVVDRQWVAEFHNNPALFDATDGAVWQRRWTLADPALAPAPDASALWLPESEGAWTMVSHEGGTLCLFSIRNDMGGSIPAAVSRSLALSTVKSGLRTLVTHASDMDTHYRAGHEVIVTPAAVEIPLKP